MGVFYCTSGEGKTLMGATGKKRDIHERTDRGVNGCLKKGFLGWSALIEKDYTEPFCLHNNEPHL